jgi:CMP/dCMP kinase
MIITIDGPAGAGKSTAARGLAERLGFEFLDTGAMYRAVAWFCLDQRVDLANEAAIARAVANVELRFDGRHILCNGRDVSVEIRSAEVSASSSVVAAVPEVRHEMVRLQREAAAGRNMVTEGRDQGSVVFADADCKFFLTADPNERAARRLEELERRGQPGSLDDVLAQIIDRDERDRNRPVGPLVMADDAIEIDSSSRTADEILDLLEATSRERLHKSS